MYRTILYSEEIWSAFGEPPVFGVMKPAKADGATISATASAALTASAIRAVRWRLSPGRKAAGFYPAPPRPGRATGFEDRDGPLDSPSRAPRMLGRILPAPC